MSHPNGCPFEELRELSSNNMANPKRQSSQGPSYYYYRCRRPLYSYTINDAFPIYPIRASSAALPSSSSRPCTNTLSGSHTHSVGSDFLCYLVHYTFNQTQTRMREDLPWHCLLASLHGQVSPFYVLSCWSKQLTI